MHIMEIHDVFMCHFYTYSIVRCIYLYIMNVYVSVQLLRRFGQAQTLDTQSSLDAVVRSVQRELVQGTSVTELHCQAMAELLCLPVEEVRRCMAVGHGAVRLSAHQGTRLSEAQRWPLLLQAATLLRRQLPGPWARWLVEGLEEDMEEPNSLAQRLTERLTEAEKEAQRCLEALRGNGATEVTEEHLVQERARKR